MKYLAFIIALAACEPRTYTGIDYEEASCGSVSNGEQRCIWRGRAYLCLGDNHKMQCAPYAGDPRVEK